MYFRNSQMEEIHRARDKVWGKGVELPFPLSMSSLKPCTLFKSPHVHQPRNFSQSVIKLYLVDGYNF